MQTLTKNWLDSQTRDASLTSWRQPWRIYKIHPSGTIWRHRYWPSLMLTPSPYLANSTLGTKFGEIWIKILIFSIPQNSFENVCKTAVIFTNQAFVPLTIFRSNSKFDQKLSCSGSKCTLPITTKFCTRHDSVTVVTCAKFRCDRLYMFQTRALQFFIEFRIRSKYR